MSTLKYCKERKKGPKKNQKLKSKKKLKKRKRKLGVCY
jgi:hypothetical protein